MWYAYFPSRVEIYFGLYIYLEIFTPLPDLKLMPAKLREIYRDCIMTLLIFSKFKFLKSKVVLYCRYRGTKKGASGKFVGCGWDTKGGRAVLCVRNYGEGALTLWMAWEGTAGPSSRSHLLPGWGTHTQQYGGKYIQPFLNRSIFWLLRIGVTLASVG